MNKAIRLTLCDNCPAIRIGLKEILGTDPEIQVVMEACSTTDVLSDYIDLDMDILLVDLEQDTNNGLESIRRLRDLRPDVKVIIFTACDNKALIMQAVELGVQGFLLKKAASSEIIKAIQTVHRGGTSLAACVTTALLEHMQTKQSHSESSLSNREQEVLNLLAKGNSNSDIANKLFITTRTVKYHVSSIFTKLNVKNRTEAAAKWVN
jgi:NarL family two-component system response regulator LiaR